MIIEELDFTKVIFWVQIHNLPLEMMTRVNAEKIGRKIGRLVEVEDPMMVEGGGRGFLRIRVAMKVLKPLEDGFWVPRRDKDRACASIRYEKLFDFCFACGKLGHL